MTKKHANYESTVKSILNRVGKNIVVGAPIGIGKPVGLLNALYLAASKDSSIQLTIITGLTLSRPIFKNALEKRFVEPILERLLKNYEDPLYEKARKLQQLPKNIRIIEFFLTPGEYLHNHYVQQNYVSSRYVRVIHDAIYYSINVFVQQVAYSKEKNNEYSLSCNTDLFYGISKYFKETDYKTKAIVAEVNLNLPFMLNDAVVTSGQFTDIVDTKNYPALFALPRESLAVQDYLIGLYTSCFVEDDSCLQIGIGKLGNALACALILRHQDNKLYQSILKKLKVAEKFGISIKSLKPFEKGLYASTEMLSDEYMQLYKAGILKKKVYDHVELQRLLNENKIHEEITPDILDVLLENKIINPKITQVDFLFLQKFGIFKSDIRYEDETIIFKNDVAIAADLTSIRLKKQIIQKCLGDHLKTGKIIHAGFFIGSKDFYKELNHLSHEAQKTIDMTSISRTNSLGWSFELSQLQRQKMRFVNIAMMITLGGATISDGLKNLQEVSGVGGQFDFVNMSQELRGSRSIINCRSTRFSKGKLTSNIVWNYPNMTIPRYLRDIFITEYGIADCCSKTDSEVVASILNITDSRFQNSLLNTAKKYGKIADDYKIHSDFQNNYVENIEPIIQEAQQKGYFQPYPFGSDLTKDEEIIANALLFLKNQSKFKLLILMINAFFSTENIGNNKYIVRLQVENPKNFKDLVYKKLLHYVIKNFKKV